MRENKGNRVCVIDADQLPAAGHRRRRERKGAGVLGSPFGSTHVSASLSLSFSLSLPAFVSQGNKHHRVVFCSPSQFDRWDMAMMDDDELWVNAVERQPTSR